MIFVFWWWHLLKSVTCTGCVNSLCAGRLSFSPSNVNLSNGNPTTAFIKLDLLWEKCFFNNFLQDGNPGWPRVAPGLRIIVFVWYKKNAFFSLGALLNSIEIFLYHFFDVFSICSEPLWKCTPLKILIWHKLKIIRCPHCNCNFSPRWWHSHSVTLITKGSRWAE